MDHISQDISLTEIDAKNASVHLGVCERNCFNCSCKPIIRAVCHQKGLTLGLIRALPETDKGALASEIRILRDQVGERVEFGI